MYDFHTSNIYRGAIFLYTKLGAPPEGRSLTTSVTIIRKHGTICFSARKRCFASCASFLHTFFWQDRNGTKQQTSEAFAVWRGRAAQWTRPAACGGARDMKLARTNARGATVAVSPHKAALRYNRRSVPRLRRGRADSTRKGCAASVALRRPRRLRKVVRPYKAPRILRARYYALRA